MPAEPEPPGTVEWRALLREATERLSAVAASPAQEASWIVEEASGHEATDAGALDALVTERGMARFDSMLGRRLAGEPLQYVLGRWGFRTLDLYVDHRVLIPRPETETVVERALGVHDELASARRRPLVVVDLGTGSGAIALSFAAERPDSEVWGTDVSPDALAVARSNLAGLGRRAVGVTLREGPWFDALPPTLEGRVDLFVSNPPYIAEAEPLPPEVADWEPRNALVAGERGVEAHEHLLEHAGRWLVADGAVVLEIAPHQRAALEDRAGARFAAVDVHADLNGRDRVLVARVPR